MERARIGFGSKVHYVHQGQAICGTGENSKIGSRTWSAASTAAVRYTSDGADCVRCCQIEAVRNFDASRATATGETVEPITLKLTYPAAEHRARRVAANEACLIEVAEDGKTGTIRPGSAYQRKRVIEALDFQRVVHGA